MEDDIVIVLQKLYLPTVDRGRETPHLNAGCITEGHGAISLSSGVVSLYFIRLFPGPTVYCPEGGGYLPEETEAA
jgi:hypothetical protein